MTNTHKYPVLKEQDLLLSVISLDQSRNQCALDLLVSNIDWSRLIRLVNQHGIFPLFYQRLKLFAGENIPPEQAEFLETTMQVHFQNSIRKTWKLIQCVDLFIENEIEYIVLKGPVSSFQVYGDLGLRYFSDIDMKIVYVDLNKQC